VRARARARSFFGVVWLTIIRDYDLVISVQSKTGDEIPNPPSPRSFSPHFVIPFFLTAFARSPRLGCFSALPPSYRPVLSIPDSDSPRSSPHPPSSMNDGDSSYPATRSGYRGITVPQLA